MRRASSFILLVIGGWLLSGAALVSFVDIGQGVMGQLGIALFALFLASPFLLAGTLLSPGSRRAELGMTLLIVAGLELFMIVAMAAIAMDPVMRRYMGGAMDAFVLSPVSGVVFFLIIAGSGYALRRSAIGKT